MENRIENWREFWYFFSKNEYVVYFVFIKFYDLKIRNKRIVRINNRNKMIIFFMILSKSQ